MKKSKAKEAKRLYINGHSVSDIARVLHITRGTVYNYKKKDLQRGVDWDELALAKLRDIESVKMSEKQFISTLIKSFEERLEEIQALDAPSALKIIKEYTSAYYKLKNPQKEDCKSAVTESVSKTIYAISQIALEDDNKAVIEFLSSKSDEIVERVLG